MSYIHTLNETPEQRLPQQFVHVQVTRDEVHDDGHAVAEHGRVGRLLLQDFKLLDVHAYIQRDSCRNKTILIIRTTTTYTWSSCI